MKAQLLTMTQFILEIDFMTTMEFCNKYGVPHPRFIKDAHGAADIKRSADNFLQIDAVKHRMFVEYAKFLRKELELEMFIGDNKIFEGFIETYNFEGIKVLKREGSDQVFSYLEHNEFTMHFPRGAKTIEDLANIHLQEYFNLSKAIS